jgi:hypothetical protein
VLRNTAAFIGLGLLVFGLVGRSWRYVLGVTVFAAGVEVAQIWIPHRFFDLKSIAASLAGIAPAWLDVVSARWLWRCMLRVLPASAPPR